MGRLLALLGVVLALAAPGRAFAHAYLERSSPAGNTVVESAPQRIQLWFTERPELRFSDVTVYASDGTVVPHGPLTLATDNPYSVSFELGTVPHGTYTVAWKTLSIDDGHTAAGAFAYAVGLEQPAPTAETIFVPASQASDVGRPSVLAVLGRALGYAGAGLVGGGPFFLLAVLWPALRARGRAERNAERGAVGPGPEAAAMLTRLHSLGVGLVALGALGVLVGQALQISGSDSAALRSTLVDLLGTRGGLLLACRLLALVPIALAVRHLAGRGWCPERPGWAAPLALIGTAAILLAQSFSSHAAATSIWTSFTIGADWVHLAAMSIWLGGLALLGLAVPWVLRARPERERPSLLAGIVNRFSAVAVWCVGVLAVSGLYQSWVHVGQLDGFSRTGYGITLLVKLALIAPLLLLGGLNLAIHGPRLRRVASGKQAGERAGALARRVRLAVRGEVVLGAAVLLTTGVLVNLPPAREALLQMGKPVTRTAAADGLKLTLTVDPAVAGLNTYDVAIADPRGNPITDAEQVALRFTHTQHDMGEIEAVLKPRGDGHYTAQGSYLSMAGVWDVDLRVRLAGQADLSVPLEVAAADPSAASVARGTQTPSLGTSFLLGLELLGLALLLAIFARRLRLPLARPYNHLVPRLGAAALGAIGLYYVTTGVMNDLTPTAALANPIPPTRASLDRGQQLYQENCETCHGPEGRGDGPTGRFLRPRPADLQQHVNAHTEGQLYWWISKGVPGSAMPAWDEKLSEEDRWNVLNFIVASFQPGGGPPSSVPSPSPSPLPSPAARDAPNVAPAPAAAAQPSAPAPVAPVPVAGRPGRGGPSALLAAQPRPDANGQVRMTLASGDLTIGLTLTPRPLAESEYAAALQDAAGRPYPGVMRVAFKLAMAGMNHGVFNQEGAPVADGLYVARGNDLIMEGPWLGWVVVELADGSVHDAAFSFVTGPAGAVDTASEVRLGSPPGVKLIGMIAYPDGLFPSEVQIAAGTPTLVEAVLADGADCGGRLRIPSLGLEAPFSASGFAQLRLTSDRPLALRARCGPGGMSLE